MKWQPKSPAYLAQYACYSIFLFNFIENNDANIKRNTTNTLLQGYNTERPEIYEIFCLKFSDNEILKINQEFDSFIEVLTVFNSLLTPSPRKYFLSYEKIHF